VHLDPLLTAKQRPVPLQLASEEGLLLQTTRLLLTDQPAGILPVKEEPDLSLDAHDFGEHLDVLLKPSPLQMHAVVGLDLHGREDLSFWQGEHQLRDFHLAKEVVVILHALQEVLYGELQSGACELYDCLAVDLHERNRVVIGELLQRQDDLIDLNSLAEISQSELLELRGLPLKLSVQY